MEPVQSLVLMASVSLDVDWTLLFQFGLILVLMVVLRALVFGPYLENLDARTAKTDDTRKDADALKAKAEELAQRHHDAIAAARSEGLGIRGDLRIAGAHYKDETISQARADAHARVEQAGARVQSELGQAREELLGQVPDIARMVAEKVLGRSV